MDSQFYNYKLLDEEETLFYEQNPKATISEILNKELIVRTPYEPTFQDKVYSKSLELKDSFDNAVSEGYYDETLNVTIKIADDDRNQFTQRITLLGLIPEAYRPETTTITDINGIPHTISLSEFFRLMLYMGMFYDTQIWNKKVSLEQQIKDAETEEDLNNINW
jgi:hypothetical protein